MLSLIRLELSLKILKELELIRVLKNSLSLRENALTDCIKAIVYLVKNEDRLRAFLDSPCGVMQNNNVEEKFRELDILRKDMIASDTCKVLIILQSSIHSIRPVFYITLILELI